MKRSPSTWNHVVEGLTPPVIAQLVSRVLWVSRRFKIHFRWKSSRESEWKNAEHIAVIEANNAVAAILATIYVDHLRGTKFRFCARPDCGKAYEVTSKHKRKFCGQYCAHLHSLREMRKRHKRRSSTRGKS
jgi:hypothetical protein